MSDSLLLILVLAAAPLVVALFVFVALRRSMSGPALSYSDRQRAITMVWALVLASFILDGCLGFAGGHPETGLVSVAGAIPAAYLMLLAARRWRDSNRGNR